MNDYLINGIGLSDTAFRSVALRSSKKPNKKDSWWHRGGELSGFSGPALIEVHLPGNRKRWPWNPCYLRMSLKCDLGQSPIPNENGRVPGMRQSSGVCVLVLVLEGSALGIFISTGTSDDCHRAIYRRSLEPRPHGTLMHFCTHQ